MIDHEELEAWQRDVKALDQNPNIATRVDQVLVYAWGAAGLLLELVKRADKLLAAAAEDLYQADAREVRDESTITALRDELAVTKHELKITKREREQHKQAATPCRHGNLRSDCATCEADFL
jgi:hypothetical protein